MKQFLKLGHVLALTGCLLLTIIQAGCGPRDSVVSSPQNANVEQVTDSVAALQKKLEVISNTGEGGSSLEGIRESIEKNVSDPAAKTSLLKDADQLNRLGDPEQIKKVASKMLKTLSK